jgi:N-acetylneuraminate synthase
MIDFNNIKEPYFIGEIGINHNGDLQIAKKLIDAVYSCGWHCAKFQKRNPDVAVPEKQKGIKRDTPWGRMTYIDYKYKVEFGKNEYDHINQYCKQKPMHWSLSVWDLDSLEFFVQYDDLPFIKIPSAMVTNNELVKASAQTGYPILMSTGMSTLKEIDKAVELLEQHAKSYAIMHCNSSYPTKNEELNLNVIPMLKERYNCTVGYSGHEYDLEPTVIAAVLGAKIIERHITISHKMWGTDQKASLEVHAMDMLKKRIQDIDIMLGDQVKDITESEKPIREKLRG